jgi:hypothetical protein
MLGTVGPGAGGVKSFQATELLYRAGTDPAFGSTDALQGLLWQDFAVASSAALAPLFASGGKMTHVDHAARPRHTEDLG